jgi:hypothetical protein
MDSIRRENFVAEFLGFQSRVNLASQILKINVKALILQNGIKYVL